MAITLQGAWTVTVKSKNAAFAQRFVVSGASNGNGTFDGIAGNSVFVNGPQWSVNIQSQAPGQPWFDSAQRITFPTVSGGLLRFDILSDDTGGDKDFNDLVLTCSMPVSASDFVVYGNVKTYAGFCRFNPCYPWYLVIETAAQLEAALANDRLRAIIKKLYPERVPRRPGPPDPGPLHTPVLIPMGAPVENSGLVFRSAAAKANAPEIELKKAAEIQKFNEANVARLKGSAHPATFDGSPVAAGSALLSKEDLLEVSKFHDRIVLHCDIQPAAGLLLNFQEYDRTASEKTGGPYTGTGTRENLGLAATDELGNYIFRFSRSLSDLADEALDVGPGETLATQIFPDLIIQAIGTGMAVDYETAPYYNIPNLIRIDLCIPYGRVHPNQGCSGDRVIQRIGDIIVLNAALGGHPNTLDSDGRITCRNANAPVVDCAAWRGGLRLYACFGKPQVSSYSVRYFRIGIDTDWQFVDETFKLNHIPDFGPGYGGTLVGSTPRSIHLDGAAGATTHPTYDNHEGDSNWIENDLKLILSSGLYRPIDSPGSVDFKIQAYDSAGNVVAGTDDTIRLYIDNRPATGDIDSITMGTTTLGDCGLFVLSSPSAPLTVRYRVRDSEGFVEDWGLSVTRGNNVSVPVDISGVAPKTYAPSNPCVDLTGTMSDPTADADGYVNATVQPSGGANWLPAGDNFCAFAFTLTADDRVTDGRTAFPRAVFWQDLIGLSSS